VEENFWNGPELEAKGITGTGSDSYGGPVVTASGLLFIAGTKDSKFKAYDKKNGDLLWETVLPVPSFATPSTYSVNGKQYIVLACGGSKLGAPKGESYMAFSLP
jgi:quinoprotein glucose dehydrogenase